MGVDCPDYVNHVAGYASMAPQSARHRRQLNCRQPEFPPVPTRFYWLIVCIFGTCQPGYHVMRTRFWKTLLALMVLCGPLTSPPVSEAGQRARGRARAAEQNPGVARIPQENPGRGRSNKSRIYQDPASTSGYDSGYDLGVADGQDGQRYDPVRHKDYRDAMRGFASTYGSKDAYKTNFRTGFRQGYEDGYREGARTR